MHQARVVGDHATRTRNERHGLEQGRAPGEVDNVAAPHAWGDPTRGELPHCAKNLLCDTPVFVRAQQHHGGLQSSTQLSRVVSRPALGRTIFRPRRQHNKALRFEAMGLQGTLCGLTADVQPGLRWRLHAHNIHTEGNRVQGPVQGQGGIKRHHARTLVLVWIGQGLGEQAASHLTHIAHAHGNTGPKRQQGTLEGVGTHIGSVKLTFDGPGPPPSVEQFWGTSLEGQDQDLFAFGHGLIDGRHPGQGGHRQSLAPSLELRHERLGHDRVANPLGSNQQALGHRFMKVLSTGMPASLGGATKAQPLAFEVAWGG